MRFSIVIPNYNSEKTIVKLLDSIKNQNCKDYEVVIVDDMSTDKSVDVIRSYISEHKSMDIKIYELTKKGYNGGTRNVGVEFSRGDYIVFADCDDWMYSENSLAELNRVIDRYPNVDLVRLSYAPWVNGNIGNVRLHETTFNELVSTVFVAPWLKCIKRELFVPFPENTLCEDVVQHIAQIDKINTFTWCDIPMMVWNRDNPDAISADGKKYSIYSKRFSSLYRQLADLLDLKLTHDYCIAERQKRVNWYMDKFHKAEEGTIVRTA